MAKVQSWVLTGPGDEVLFTRIASRTDCVNISAIPPEVVTKLREMDRETAGWAKLTADGYSVIPSHIPAVCINCGVFTVDLFCTSCMPPNDPNAR